MFTNLKLDRENYKMGYAEFQKMMLTIMSKEEELP